MTTVAVAGARGKTGKSVVRAIRAAGMDAVPAPRPYDLPAVDAVYFIAPNLYPDEPGLVSQAIDAGRAAGAETFVYHSVAWPYCPSMPHHLDKAAAEVQVRASGLDWTILQPCAYLQNFSGPLEGPTDRVAVPYDPDAPFAFIDVGDVAEIAATVLADRSGRHRNATYELGGPEPLSVRQLAAACGRRYGTPIDVRRVPLSEWEAPVGLSPEARDRLIAMFAFYDAHGFTVGGAVSEMLLGRPARRLADVLAGTSSGGASGTSSGGTSGTSSGIAGSPAHVANSAGAVGQSSISPATGRRP